MTQLTDLLKEATQARPIGAFTDDYERGTDCLIADVAEAHVVVAGGMTMADAKLLAWLWNHAEAMERVIESADAVADFLKGTAIVYDGGAVQADHANIVIGLRDALAELDAEVGA